MTEYEIRLAVAEYDEELAQLGGSAKMTTEKVVMGIGKPAAEMTETELRAAVAEYDAELARAAEREIEWRQRYQRAERELRAVRDAPPVATVVQAPGPYELRELQVKRCISHLSDSCFLPQIGTELIARPTRKEE